MFPSDFPAPNGWTVRRGRDAYLAENGFTVASYDEPWTPVAFFSIPFRIPNTKRHAWALRLHDLHHVATGYGTDIIGEGEISMWELRRGLRPLGLYVGLVVLMVAALGFMVAPRRMIAAWRAAGDTNLFVLDPPYEDLLEFTVKDLRNMLALPARRHRLDRIAPPPSARALADGLSPMFRARSALAPGRARAFFSSSQRFGTT